MEESLLANVFARQSSRLLAGLGLSLAALGLNSAALAADTFNEPRPFEAQYRLEVRGWPGATITHRLTNEGSHWLSDMRFSITVARGQEFSRFAVDGDDTQSLLFNSSYSVLGVGDRYELN